MSETATEATATATEPADEQTTATPAQPTESLGDAGKQALDRMKAERDSARRDAKANADAAKRLQEFEESQKTEQQKVADRAAQAQREAAEARTETLRYKAAAKHGIGEDHFDLIGSGDEETIDARAERVGKLLADQRELAQVKTELEALRAGRPVPSNGRPVEDLKPGATPSNPTIPPDDSYPEHFLPRRMRERINGQT